MNTKTRTYTGVFYPGEGVVPLVPLIEHMKAVMLPGIISPIHAADDKQTKPHVHFMVDYPNAVRLETARSDYGEVAANGYLEPVRSRKAMMRYFLHLDDEDKEQLNQEDVLTVCGAIFDTTQDLTADDIQRILIEIQDYCDQAHILEYADLCKVTRLAEKYDWYRVVTSHTIHYAAYFRSLRNKDLK
jgi:hypothetical protein